MFAACEVNLDITVLSLHAMVMPCTFLVSLMRSCSRTQDADRLLLLTASTSVLKCVPRPTASLAIHQVDSNFEGCISSSVELNKKETHEATGTITSLANML